MSQNTILSKFSLDASWRNASRSMKNASVWGSSQESEKSQDLLWAVSVPTETLWERYSVFRWANIASILKHLTSLNQRGAEREKITNQQWSFLYILLGSGYNISNLTKTGIFLRRYWGPFDPFRWHHLTSWHSDLEASIWSTNQWDEEAGRDRLDDRWLTDWYRRASWLVSPSELVPSVSVAAYGSNINHRVLVRWEWTMSFIHF